MQLNMRMLQAGYWWVTEGQLKRPVASGQPEGPSKKASEAYIAVVGGQPKQILRLLVGNRSKKRTKLHASKRRPVKSAEKLSVKSR